ncbi:hypothetical protein BU15DRAFT_67782 [Melanogaster broomeanus]|nr:hypothetical protein BU15DRAFT_67782 [Melanogaster broomeanus]
MSGSCMTSFGLDFYAFLLLLAFHSMKALKEGERLTKWEVPHPRNVHPRWDEPHLTPLSIPFALPLALVNPDVDEEFLFQNGRAFSDEYLGTNLHIFCFQIALTGLGEQCDNGILTNPLNIPVTIPNDKKSPQDFKITEARYFHNIQAGEGVEWLVDASCFFMEKRAKPVVLVAI